MPRVTIFELENFKLSHRMPNKSNRSCYTCRHCNETMERRESSLLIHLSRYSLCPKTPIEVRLKSATHLAESKGATEATAPAPPPPVLDEAQVNGNEPEQALEPPMKKARLCQQGSMSAFVDRAMSKEEIAQADYAFLRYCDSMNISCMLSKVTIYTERSYPRNHHFALPIITIFATLSFVFVLLTTFQVHSPSPPLCYLQKTHALLHLIGID